MAVLQFPFAGGRPPRTHRQDSARAFALGPPPTLPLYLPPATADRTESIQSCAPILLSVLLSLASALFANCVSYVPTQHEPTDLENGVILRAPGSSFAATTAENATDHDTADDCAWDEEDVVAVVLADEGTTADEDGVSVTGKTVTIEEPGTYLVYGALSDGQLVVDVAGEGVVRVILSDVALTSSTVAPVVVRSAEKAVFVLEGASTVEDGATYTAPDADEELNAAFFSKSDLTLCGDGSLAVTGRYNDGLASKDGLVLKDVTLSVTAVDDGIRGKDYVVLKDATVTVSAGGDGIKSDNEIDLAAGYISVNGGAIDVTAGGDGLAAATDLLVAEGTVTCLTAGGHGSPLATSLSAKGLKGLVSVVIDGGAITADTADDAVHSNGLIAINGGALTLAAGDDAIHADSSLAVGGAVIDVETSYEGLESAVITISDGEIHIVAGDDGLNAAGGVVGSGMGAGSADPFAATGEYSVGIEGGYLVVDALGDGLDSNGGVGISGGTTVVNGPDGSQNAAIDTAFFSLTGGTLVAAHVGMMADEITGDLSQNVLQVALAATLAGGTLAHLENKTGHPLLTFAPTRPYRVLLFSSPYLAEGSYSLYTGGTDSGTPADGLYEDGTYDPGTLYAQLTVTSGLTTLGNGMGRTPVGGRP